MDLMASPRSGRFNPMKEPPEIRQRDADCVTRYIYTDLMASPRSGRFNPKDRSATNVAGDCISGHRDNCLAFSPSSELYRRRGYVPPKRQFLQEPHGLTSQKTPFFK
jgi:hypothetical protein